MKQNKKQILFASGTIAGASVRDGALEVDAVAAPGVGERLDVGGRADVLLNRAAAWMTQELISYAQYDLLRQRLKKEPAVTDIKLDGNVLVLSIDDGTEERIFPEDPNLPPIDIIDHVPFYKKAWYWIKNHKAVAVGCGSAVLLLVVVLIIKHARS